MLLQHLGIRACTQPATIRARSLFLFNKQLLLAVATNPGEAGKYCFFLLLLTARWQYVCMVQCVSTVVLPDNVLLHVSLCSRALPSVEVSFKENAGHWPEVATQSHFFQRYWETSKWMCLPQELTGVTITSCPHALSVLYLYLRYSMNLCKPFLCLSYLPAKQVSVCNRTQTLPEFLLQWLALIPLRPPV